MENYIELGSGGHLADYDYGLHLWMHEAVEQLLSIKVRRAITGTNKTGTSKVDAISQAQEA